MRKNLVIRADVNTGIGSGHLMRCLALAQVWQNDGGSVTFLMAKGASALEIRLKQEGINVERLSSLPGGRDDAIKTINLANDQGANWVVVDGYHFDSEYRRTIKDSGLRLLFIDDMGYAEHYWADIVLNQNIYAVDSLYAAKETYTSVLLGTNYVLLRREFLKFRGWKREISKVARKVLVTMGGADPDNVTLKVIQALNRMDCPELEVRVVAGPSNPNKELLINAMRHAPCPMFCVENASNMAELMAWADLAVTAGGSTCWELAYMGLPGLMIVLSENQEGIAEWLNKAGASINLGRHNKVSTDHIARVLSSTVQSSDQRHNMSQTGMSLVDGMGAARVVEELRRRNDIGVENAHSIFG